MALFGTHIVVDFLKYYESEIDGIVHNNLQVERSTQDNRVMGSARDLTVNNHFVVCNPTDEVITKTSGVLKCLNINRQKYLFSTFTYNYYFNIPLHTIVILFAEKDIFGKCTVITKKLKKCELFEIAHGLNAEDTIRYFLHENNYLFNVEGNTELEITKIGNFSRYFERKLINNKVIIETDIYI